MGSNRDQEKMRPSNGDLPNKINFHYQIHYRNQFSLCLAWALTTCISAVELGDSDIEHGLTFVRISINVIGMA
jgi:hypothetical protein